MLQLQKGKPFGWEELGLVSLGAVLFICLGYGGYSVGLAMKAGASWLGVQ